MRNWIGISLFLLSLCAAAEPLTNFFDEARVVQRQSIIELKSIYGVDPLRDIASGDVTNNGTEFVLTGSNGTDATLSSAERGPYPPGQEVEPGIAARLPGALVGGQVARIGYYDNNDGWFFEFDAQGLETVVRRDGVDTGERWGSWDAGQIVRTAGSGVAAFDPSLGYVYQIPFTWYGYGPTEFNFQLAERTGGKWIRAFNTVRPANQTSVIQPHLPLRAEVLTEAGDPAFTLYVSGRQVSVVGEYNPIFRETSVEVEAKTVASTEWTPLVAVRRQSVYPYALTKLAHLEIYSDTPVRLAVVENTAVPSTGWESVTGYAEGLSLLEQNLTVSTTFTDLSTAGNLLGKTRVSGSSQGSSKNGGGDQTFSRMPMIEGRPFTIYARQFQGGASGPVSITATFREDY